MQLAEFLLQRITEDEAAARAATGGPWTWHEYARKGEDPVPYLTGRGGDPETYAYDAEVIEPDHSGECGCRSACVLDLRVRHDDREHIARHDPARVLAECEAKRQLIDGFSAWGPDAEWALGVLALPYAGHPDFRDEWKP